MSQILNVDFEGFKSVFTRILSENQLEEFTCDSIIKEFYQLTEMLLEENEKTNLTAITDVEGIITKHYCDCLKICKHIPKGAEVLDVGCGGGFPTLPIAIARKDLDITAMDSTAKKLDFVIRAAAQLGLNVATLAARAEETARREGYREGFDVVCARAVSRLNVLSELCIPLVRKGGVFISMKGSSGKEELSEAEKGISVLGGKISLVDEFTMSGMQRYIFVIEKSQPTSDKYPRMYSKICKKPL